MRKAVVKDGKVINVILAAKDFTLPGYELVTLADNSQVDHRWIYENGEFTRLPEPESEPEIETEPIKNPLELRIEALETEIAKLKNSQAISK